MKQHTDETLFFVISVDTPMITQKAISKLYQFMVEHLIEDQLDIAGFQEDGMPIPTMAFYSPHTLSFIEAALESGDRSEEHTSELQSRFDLVCRLLLEKKN